MNQERKKVESAEHRLTHNEKLRVLQWFVELRSNYEISDLIKQHFGKSITPRAVWSYRYAKKWKPIIARLRKQFEKAILKIPIANKVDRLRYLQTIVREGLKWSLKSISKDGTEIYELKLGAVAQAVKEARIEMEGEKPLIDNSKHRHYYNIKVGDLKEKSDSDIVDIVLGRANATNTN